MFTLIVALISILSENRYWSKDNVYAEQNGGQFQFYMGKDFSRTFL